MKQDRLGRKEGEFLKGNQRPRGQKDKGGVYKTAQGGKQNAGQDDVKENKHEKGAVDAAGKVDHAEERHQIERNLHMSKDDKMLDLLGFTGFESFPYGQEHNIA